MICRVQTAEQSEEKNVIHHQNVLLFVKVQQRDCIGVSEGAENVGVKTRE